MAKTNLNDKLKGLQKDWKSAEPRKGQAPVPDGDYSMRIESATIEESKNSKRLQIKWQLTILEPEESEGRKIMKFDGLDSAESLGWLQGTLETLGLDIPEDINDLGETLEQAQGLVVSATVATKGDYNNIYFNELVEGMENDGEDDGKEKDNEAAEAEDGEDEGLTEEAFDKITDKKELIQIIEDYDLKDKVNPKKYPTVSLLKKAMKKALFE